MELKLVRVIINFFELADEAATLGGMVATRKGGTKNVMAGVITKRCNIEFEVALKMIDTIGKAWCLQNFKDVDPKEWYEVFCELQRGGTDNINRPWDAKTIMNKAFDTELGLSKINV